MKKTILIIILTMLFICLLFGWINYNIVKTQERFILETERYLEEKYNEKMVVTDNVIIGDERSVQVHLADNPQLTFFVRKGDGFVDTFLAECLVYETKELLRNAFSK